MPDNEQRERLMLLTAQHAPEPVGASSRKNTRYQGTERMSGTSPAPSVLLATEAALGVSAWLLLMPLEAHNIAAAPS